MDHSHLVSFRFFFFPFYSLYLFSLSCYPDTSRKLHRTSTHSFYFPSTLACFASYLPLYYRPGFCFRLATFIPLPHFHFSLSFPCSFCIPPPSLILLRIHIPPFVLSIFIFHRLILHSHPPSLISHDPSYRQDRIKEIS
ncbi:hypothetical protein BOTBODRAFT_536180 [Botryobasidium botryosum FD-172 SS1]|uniref:Uncharacterized protein n=1 Tax=Botryobasidium botryosum (strain FD-172 SS1) TaxID=930990 RepID=A0A067M334_BOTB1|nr:hypothetical protein BOTBODRAFT_536180 [Botryobasidium botryosum FD-172 SS1]